MTLQQEVIAKLRCKAEINVGEEIRLTINFLKDYIKKNSFVKSLVLGISGGQDSTLCGKLCQMAVDELKEETGKEYSFIAVRLPYGEQFDEADCNDALEFIKPDKVYTVNIKDAVDASVNSLKIAGVEITDFAKGNEKAREQECTISISKKIENLSIHIDNQELELKNIDAIDYCVPDWMWCKKYKSDFYIAIRLYILCYSSSCNSYYYILMYLHNNKINNYKIIDTESPLSDKQIKHYMRNGLKY